MQVIGRASLTARLTVLFAAASSAVLLLLGYVIANSVEKHFEQQDFALLHGKLELVEHALTKVDSPAELAALPQQLAASMVGHTDISVLVLAPDGNTLFATPGAKFPESLTRGAAAGRGASSVWRSDNGHPSRGISQLAGTRIPGAPPAVIVVTVDILHHENFMAAFKRTLSMVVALASVLTGFLGWAAARSGLAPLRAMRHEVAAITARRLDSRLSQASVPHELAELAGTLNLMLARLEDSFRRLSNFSSDLAHELRTPVSNILTQTQVTLSKTRSVGEYEDILASNVEEFERLSRIISDMLFLAKSENDLVIPNREPIDLLAEVNGVLEFYDALVQEKGVVVVLAGAGEISGDRPMVRRAINNLVSNAVRHTSAGGKITVRIIPVAGAGVELCVENEGDEIAAEHLPRLFDRFYRVDYARQRQSDGAGLGLAITRSILRAHGGDAVGRSEQGKSTFCLKFAEEKAVQAA